MSALSAESWRDARALPPISGTLLIISDREDTARRIETSLRNLGHPLRVRWTPSLDELEDQLRNQPPDLVIADREAPGSARDRVIERCRRLQPDLPLLLLGSAPTLDAIVAAQIAGADDLVGCDDATQLRHLERTVAREISRHAAVHALRRAQVRLADFEARHARLTDSTGDAVASIQEGIVVRANTALARLLGRDDASTLAGQPLIDLIASDQQGAVKDRLRAAQRGQASLQPEPLRLAGRSGPVPVLAQMIAGSLDGEPIVELLIRSDAGPARSAASGSPPIAGTAAASGPGAPESLAAARTAFRSALAEPVGDDGRVRAALLVRIDDFAGIESRIGDIAAAELGALVAASIRRRLPPDEPVLGYGTEEFAVVLRRRDIDTIERQAETLRRELREEIFAIHDHETQVSLSIAVFQPGPADKPDAIVRQLAEEVRAISAKDGNRVALIGSATRDAQREREEARIAALTKRALVENRMKLASQPIASLEGDTRNHFDLLVRMTDESGREWTASEFLPAAQKFNLMRSIDRWVIGQALELSQRRSPPQDCGTLFVKLSEDTIRDAEAFIVWLRELLGGRRLAPDSLVFEAQELVLQNHIRKARALARELVELGAGVAIEHFGIGPNSLQMLDYIPAGFLKFHPSFMQKFGDRTTLARLSELVEAAKQRRMRTIVSHVEDANVMARLWQIGVNYISGYHIQEPEVVLLGDASPAGRG